MKEQVLNKDYFLWGFLKNINNKYLRQLCLNNYNIRMSQNTIETRSEDIILPKDKNLLKITDQLSKLYEKKYKKILRLVNFWAQVHFKNECTMPHDHANIFDLFLEKPDTPDISGVYYIDAPKYSGDIVFDYWTNRYIQHTWRVPPETGKYLLFPSGMTHKVLKNVTNEPRICISFNFRTESRH